MKNPTQALASDELPRAAPLAVAVTLAMMLFIGIACTQSQPEPSTTMPSFDGATWILESIDGHSPIADTHLTLTVDGLSSLTLK